MKTIVPKENKELLEGEKNPFMFVLLGMYF